MSMAGPALDIAIAYFAAIVMMAKVGKPFGIDIMDCWSNIVVALSQGIRILDKCSLRYES